MAGKVIKKEVFKDKYFTAIVYEYRGCTYEVTYANGWQVCCTPAWVQHRDEQAKSIRCLIIRSLLWLLSISQYRNRWMRYGK